MASRRWLLLVAAAAVCTALYLGFELGGYAMASVGGRVTLWATVPAVIVVGLLAVATIRLCAAIADPAGEPTGAMVGRGRSHAVGGSIGVQVAFLLFVSPLLTVLGNSIGLHGTTNIPLEHRSDGLILIVSWAAILVAPWMEEVSMRGFLLSGLELRFGFWPAAVGSSLVWAALHGVGGVLIPFVAEGIVLCWICRRTGSVRTGVGLHAAQNTVASLVTGATFWIAPPLILAVASLWVTRGGSDDWLTRFARDSLRWAGETAGLLAAGFVDWRPPRAEVWTLAGTALGTGAAIAGAQLIFGLGGHTGLTLGRSMIAIVALPLLAWLLGTAVRLWHAPPGMCVLGAAGCAIAAVSRLADLYAGIHSLLPLVAFGYVLIAFGLCGLVATQVALRARILAGVAGILLVFTIVPVPYLTTTENALINQTVLAYLATAVAIAAIGRALPRRIDQGTHHALHGQRDGAAD